MVEDELAVNTLELQLGVECLAPKLSPWAGVRDLHTMLKVGFWDPSVSSSRKMARIGGGDE